MGPISSTRFRRDKCTSTLPELAARFRVLNGSVQVGYRRINPKDTSPCLWSYSILYFPLKSQSPQFPPPPNMAESPIAQGHFVHNNTVPPAQQSLMGLFSLKGRTAIVTGAGAGIGLAVAQGYAEAGANVAIWYNSNQKTVERAAEIETKYGVQCRCFTVVAVANDPFASSPDIQARPIK